MSKNDKLQKLSEAFHIEKFHQLYGIPGVPITGVNIVHPDFLYKSSDFIIGIEHTELNLPNLTELKGTQRNIVHNAQKLAEDEALPPIEVRVGFNDYYTDYPRKGDRQAKAIFQTIKKHIKDIEQSQSLSLGSPKPFCGITRIDVTTGRINGKQCLNNHRWMIYEVGWVMRGFIEELQSAIQKKNRLIDEYRKNCDICWLLVAINRRKSDQKFEFTDEMSSHVYHSCFNKTFFMDVASNYFIELKG
ncbi:MAG: hypothetical protein WA126_10565 [Thermodesulfovibrionales bacterium]